MSGVLTSGSSIDEALRLGQAIAGYTSTLPIPERENNTRELGRFGRWLGTGTPIRSIAPADIARYQEALPETGTDINQRLEPVKTFLAYLKSEKLISVNLAAHVRLRRASARRAVTAVQSVLQAEAVRMTEQGYAALQQELEHLEKEVRPRVTEDLGRAYADRDFRENAPYDAAKQQLAEVQGRINDIRGMLAAAAIHTTDSDEIVDLGTTVTLRDLQEDEEVIYTIVGPGEVSLRAGKISAQSPVGRALVNHRMGEVVEVVTPAGAVSYRIEHIERRGAEARA